MNLNGVSAAVQTSFHFHCLSFERGRYRGIEVLIRTLDPSIHRRLVGGAPGAGAAARLVERGDGRIRPNRSSQLTHTRSGELIDGVSYWWEEGGAQDVV